MPEVTVADTKYTVPPLNGVAGLEVAQILIPRLVETREAFNSLIGIAAGVSVDKKGNVQMDEAATAAAFQAAMDIGKSLLPLLAPDEFVRLTSLLTAVSEDELRKATLVELLAAAAVGLVNADIPAVLAATGKIYAEVIRAGRNGSAPPAPTEG